MSWLGKLVGGKSYPNEEFSRLMRMISDVDSTCVHIRFRIGDGNGLYRDDVPNILKLLRTLTP